MLRTLTDLDLALLALGGVLPVYDIHLDLSGTLSLVQAPHPYLKLSSSTRTISWHTAKVSPPAELFVVID